MLELSSYDEAVVEVKRVGVDSYSVPILASKAFGLSVKIEELDCAQSNIIKQTALSVGADAAVARGVVTGCSEKTDLILLCTRRQFEQITTKLAVQPLGLKRIAEDLSGVLDRVGTKHKLSLPRCNLDLSQRTHIMGVLNVTPDSFSDGGRHFERDKAIEWGMKMAEDGADIIDIGGESTRPGSQTVSVEEEIERIVPVIDALSRDCALPLSIDTRKGEVSERAIDAGCSIVNDVTGLTSDQRVADTVARKGAALVIGHIRGTPSDMQEKPFYEDVMGEVFRELKARIELAESRGVLPTRIIIDPGIGFGKRLEDNLTILRRLGELRSLGKPIMVGPSRKSFIGKVLDLPVDERLEGTAAAVAVAVANGAHLVRVHDVKEMRRVCMVAEAIVRAGRPESETEG
jgi:dihydropteroate synthase